MRIDTKISRQTKRYYYMTVKNLNCLKYLNMLEGFPKTQIVTREVHTFWSYKGQMTTT